MTRTMGRRMKSFSRSRRQKSSLTGLSADGELPEDPSANQSSVGHPTPGPEVILFVKDPNLFGSFSSAAQNSAHHLEMPASRPASGLLHLLAEASADVEPLFDDEDLRQSAGSKGNLDLALSSGGGLEVPLDGGEIELRSAFRVNAPPDHLDRLVKRLSEDEAVDGVFIKPPVEPAARVNMMAAAPAPAPQATPDFEPMQGYLHPGPGGIDARHAWGLSGGRGSGVRVVDLEGEWRYTHEDLGNLTQGVLGGSLPNSLLWRNHGTAVAGVLVATHNGFGVSGICPDARVATISSFGPAPWGSAKAIRRSVRYLKPGDILLIELHRPGPRLNFASRPQDQKGYIAIEWWPDDFAAIRYATRNGIIVVAAAGNGAENLDDSIYDNGPVRGKFPAWWKNPFKRAALDSGGILVGAGAAPSGSAQPDRSRLPFSNFGSCVDCQGWGERVTTSGYGNLQGGPSEDRWYTDDFSGTSSASPVVVGALACVQGVLRKARRAPHDPASARSMTRTIGSPQIDPNGSPIADRIGPRPDLKYWVAHSMQFQAKTGTKLKKK